MRLNKSQSRQSTESMRAERLLRASRVAATREAAALEHRRIQRRDHWRKHFKLTRDILIQWGMITVPAEQKLAS